MRDERGAEECIEIGTANAFVEMLTEFARATLNLQSRQRLWDAATRQAEIVLSVEAALHK